MKTIHSACWLAFFLILVLAAHFPARAQSDEDYGTDTDYLSFVNKAPGTPEGSTFAKFLNNESVSLINGNLSVTHPGSPSFPVEGGWSISLTRYYNSKSIRLQKLENVGPVPAGMDRAPLRHVFSGHGWAGAGWVVHFGRLLHKPVYAGGSMYDHRRFYYEEPNGTLHMLDPFQTEDGLPFKWEPFSEEVCTYPGGKPPCTPGSACCPQNGEPPVKPGSDPICRIYLETCDCDGIEVCEVARSGYKLIHPDGTVFYMEKLVEEELISRNDWIANYDTAGWYATEIVDVHGNRVWIDYARSGPHPEAIIAARIQRQGEGVEHTVLTTVLWGDEHASEPGYNAALNGMLKELHSTVFGGHVAVTTYSYDVVEVVDWGEEPDHVVPVALLSEVTLPAIQGGETGTIQYGYQDVGLLGEEKTPRLSRLQSPTGGISEYEYSSFRSGRRDGACPFQDWSEGPVLCDVWRRRYSIGVSRRTVFPDGDGGRSVSWRWERAFHPAAEPSGEYPGEPEVNRFTMIQPDGSFTVSTQAGGFSGDGPYSGREETRTWHNSDPDGDGTQEARAVRQETYSYSDDGYDFDRYERFYIGVRMETKKTIFLDDDGAVSGDACMNESAPAAAGGIPVERYSQARTLATDRDSLHQPRKTTLGSSYSRDDRITYRRYEDPVDSPSCRTAMNIFGKYSFKAVEEGDERLESHYEYDCVGSLTQIWENATYAIPGGDEHSERAREAGCLAHSLIYSSITGNLERIGYHGGEGESCAANEKHAATFTWSNGMAQTAAIESLGYNASEIVTGPAGFVRTSTDPNGLTTSFDYDALGRLTRITPSGESGEEETRVIYPSLRETRIIQSAGLEVDYSSANEQQLYADQAYDGLGRLIQLRKAMPGDRMAVQVIRYDGLGREIFRSSWIPDGVAETNTTIWFDAFGNYSVKIPVGADGSPWGTTTFYGEPDPAAPDNPLRGTADALSRVRRLVRADGSTQTKRYCGPHEEVTVEGIQSSTDGATISSTTRLYRDGLGQLVLVDSDATSGSGGAGADAIYEYDLRGNLTEVKLLDQLPSDRFGTWIARGTDGLAGQTRSFDFDAHGRLIASEQPEDGRQEFFAYDVWGQVLKWAGARGLSEGYRFENTLDVHGRVVATSKVLLSELDRDPLGGTESFDSLGSWEEGLVEDGLFTPGPTLWRTMAYGSGPGQCTLAPPTTEGNSNGLHFGSTACNYQDAPAETQAIRRTVTGVHHDDRLGMMFWRHVREHEFLGSGNRDELAIWVRISDSASPDDLSGKRILLRLSEAQASWQEWRSLSQIPLGSLFSEAEWAPGTTKSLDIYIAFTRDDCGSSSGIGTGVVIDELTLGHPAYVLLTEQEYDVDYCGSSPGRLCGQGEDSVNRFKGHVTAVTSYQDGQKIARRRMVFKGRGGRPSGVDQSIDWSGLGRDSGVPTWTWWREYNAQGQVESLWSPHLSTEDELQLYEVEYERGLLLDLYRALDSGDYHAFFGEGDVPLAVDFRKGERFLRVDSTSSDAPGGGGIEGPDLGFEGADELRHVAVAFHPAELGFGLQNRRPRPAQDHRTTAPASYVSSELRDRAVEVLNGVGRVKAFPQRT